MKWKFTGCITLKEWSSLKGAMGTQYKEAKIHLR